MCWWALVLVGIRPGGHMSWWAGVLVGRCPGGRSPSGQMLCVGQMSWVGHLSWNGHMLWYGYVGGFVRWVGGSHGWVGESHGWVGGHTGGLVVTRVGWWSHGWVGGQTGGLVVRLITWMGWSHGWAGHAGRLVMRVGYHVGHLVMWACHVCSGTRAYSHLVENVVVVCVSCGCRGFVVGFSRDAMRFATVQLTLHWCDSPRICSCFPCNLFLCCFHVFRLFTFVTGASNIIASTGTVSVHIRLITRTGPCSSRRASNIIRHALVNLFVHARHHMSLRSVPPLNLK